MGTTNWALAEAEADRRDSVEWWDFMPPIAWYCLLGALVLILAT